MTELLETTPASTGTLHIDCDELTAAFDSETLYDTDYSVSDLGPQGYVNDPRFKCYLVSWTRSDGVRYVGPPESAPWKQLQQCIHVVSHNKGFDHAVLQRLIELEIAPCWAMPFNWFCTANMMSYLGFPRSLAKGVAHAFGISVDKNIRNVAMKGRVLEDFDPVMREKVIAYAQKDTDYCLALWAKYNAEWPEHERRLSELTYSMGEYGVPMDREGLDRDIELLSRALFNAQQRIPWRHDAAILSPKALAEQCRSVGIEPPVSLAKTSDECAEWEEKYGAQYPWVAAMRDYRRVNALLEKFKTMRLRTNEAGRMPYSLLYFGAHTGRWSGSGGVNMQNLPRSPFYFDENLSITPQKTDTYVDLRSKIKAGPGKKLVIADYAQIEARITPWLCGDTRTLDLARQGISVYEVHARTSMGWAGGLLKKENPALYQLAKARVLGLGFGCGWHKFVVLAGQMLDKATFDQIFAARPSDETIQDFIGYQRWLASKGFMNHLVAWHKQDPVTQNIWVNAWHQVKQYRESNPLLCGKDGLWRTLEKEMRSSVGGMHPVELPSGRLLRYFNVHLEEDVLMAQQTRGEHRTHFTGGLITENAVQATARDIIGEAKLRLLDAGYAPIMSVHDEIVCEVDEADDCGPAIENLMTQNPSWARTLPLGVEWAYETNYCK